MEVVVAKSDLLPGHLLGPEDLKIAQRPVFGLGTDYARDIEAFLAANQWYVGSLGLGKGDILRPSRLSTDSEASADLLMQVSLHGKRLIAVETNLVRSCASWLVPGTKVDALVYIKGKEGYETTPDQVIGPQDDPNLRDLLVVDKKNGSGLALDLAADAALGKDYLPVVVTLLLDQSQEEKAKALIRYNEQGKIYFSPTAVNKDYLSELASQGQADI